MALVSPGLQLTVTDQSQYVPAAVGTVPLVVLATAQDKTINGSVASGTTSANAGVLQVFGSQRELVTALGYPTFKQSSAGTPLHGNELNEYGLMAAYSTLGLGNRVYAIRADVDLDQLTGTSVRPTGSVADGTYWEDLANTTWGINEWSSDTQSFTTKTPILITSNTQTTTSTFNCIPVAGVANGNVTVVTDTPISSVGQVGSYAVVTTTVNNRIFVKDLNNDWQLVGSQEWQNVVPTVVGTVTSPTVANLSPTLTINGVDVTSLAQDDTVSDIADAINGAVITGVTADVRSNRLVIFADNTAKSDGSTVDGRLTVSGNVLDDVGIDANTYYSPTVQYGTYAEIPAWTVADSTARSTGSVWFKLGATGNGSNIVIKRYNLSTNTWTSQAVTNADGEYDALAKLDLAGGSNIAVGTIYVAHDLNDVSGTTATLGTGSYKAFVRRVAGAVSVTGTTPNLSTGSFTISVSKPGSSDTQASDQTATITVSGTTAASFVSAVLAANLPNLFAQVNANGTITLTHLAGGSISMRRITGQPNIPYLAGFTSGVTGVRSVGSTDSTNTLRVITGFDVLPYTYSLTTPTADPADGTLWYNSDATTVDIMINSGSAWYGYRSSSLTNDARGYNLQNTDPAGVIVSASQPTSQSDNNALAQGDLWLDTSDLENWPKLSRYNGSSWIAIDNTDQISQNGIVFADARWDVDGTTDPISGDVVDIATMLTSDYTDLDCPDPRLYPRGTLLFNTRRSGYNVKRFVNNYFNADSFTGSLPAVTSTWVSASGNKADGSMYAGHQAQRRIVVAAMQAAIDANTQIREDQFVFNLIAAPGYPELIDNMVALNNDRSNTAFVVGDTPMTLSTNVTEITNWSNGVTEGGLTTADPYLGVYYPSGLSSDVQGNTIMVPPSHMALRTFIHSDNVSFPWFAPAGTRRGLVDNATDLGYLNATTGEFTRTGVNQGLRDSLYSININPITIMTGTGIVVWGQKTRNPSTSAMDRINVARLVNYIRTILAKSGNAFLFEPNDKITRDQLKQIIESSLNDLVAKRGIYDYLVVCDTSNNTADRIARNELYVDIAIEPMKDVEFIYIPIRLLNPGSIGGLGK